MYETKLSVVIVNYNVKYLLEQCLRSVLVATNGFDAEIWVVDNASTDGSIEYLRPRFPDVRFIENTDNSGFARANNQALRICRGEYVLLFNLDMIVGDSLRTLCYFMPSSSSSINSSISESERSCASLRAERSEERRVGKECRSRWSPYH